jgi:hypothetical protein
LFGTLGSVNNLAGAKTKLPLVVMLTKPYNVKSAAITALIIAIVALIAATPKEAIAWGFEAHRLIAEQAEHQLSPAAKAEAYRLLSAEAGSTLRSISTWADERKSRATAHWHYVNLPRDSCSYERSRDCPGGRCVVEAIAAQAAILKSKAPDANRLTALKYLVHLVGDVHQPLHAGYADDRGGNLYQLRSFGKGSNLHALWDSGLVKNWGLGSAVALEDEISALSRGATPAMPAAAPQWAIESCKIVGATSFYPSDRKVGAEYLRIHGATLKGQLAVASKRLAGVLNDALR